MTVLRSVSGVRYDTAPLGTGKNWVTHTDPVSGLGPFIRAIAHALIRNGHPEGEAIAIAVGTVKRWAAGGGHVSAKTRAKAAEAVAHWEAMKAKNAVKGAAKDVAGGKHDRAESDEEFLTRAAGAFAAGHPFEGNQYIGGANAPVPPAQAGQALGGLSAAQVYIMASAYQSATGQKATGQFTNAQLSAVMTGTNASKNAALATSLKAAQAAFQAKAKQLLAAQTKATNLANQKAAHQAALDKAAASPVTSGSASQAKLINGLSPADRVTMQASVPPAGFKWSSGTLVPATAVAQVQANMVASSAASAAKSAAVKASASNPLNQASSLASASAKASARPATKATQNQANAINRLTGAARVKASSGPPPAGFMWDDSNPASPVLVLANRSTGTISRTARKVHTVLAKHYPESTLGWVDDAEWDEPKRIPLSKVQMDRRPGGRDMEKVDGIAQGIKAGAAGATAPVVLVKTPGSGKLKVADGYHRTLARKRAGQASVPAYVATVQDDAGPWDKEMHDKKLNREVDEILDTRNWAKWHAEHPYEKHPRMKEGETPKEFNARMRAEFKGGSGPLSHEEFKKVAAKHGIEGVQARTYNASATTHYAKALSGPHAGDEAALRREAGKHRREASKAKAAGDHLTQTKHLAASHAYTEASKKARGPLPKVTVDPERAAKVDDAHVHSMAKETQSAIDKAAKAHLLDEEEATALHHRVTDLEAKIADEKHKEAKVSFIIKLGEIAGAVALTAITGGLALPVLIGLVAVMAPAFGNEATHLAIAHKKHKAAKAALAGRGDDDLESRDWAKWDLEHKKGPHLRFTHESVGHDDPTADWKKGPDGREHQPMQVIKAFHPDTGKMVGYLTHHQSYDPDEGTYREHVGTMEVNPAHEHQGVGKALLGEIRKSVSNNYYMDEDHPLDPGKFTPQGAAFWKKVTGEDVKATEKLTQAHHRPDWADARSIGEFGPSGTRADMGSVVTESSSAGTLLPVGPSAKQSAAITAMVSRHRFVGGDLNRCGKCGKPVTARVHKGAMAEVRADETPVEPVPEMATLGNAWANAQRASAEVAISRIEKPMEAALKSYFARQRSAVVSRLTGKRGKQMLKRAAQPPDTPPPPASATITPIGLATGAQAGTGASASPLDVGQVFDQAFWAAQLETLLNSYYATAAASGVARVRSQAQIAADVADRDSLAKVDEVLAQRAKDTTGLLTGDTRDAVYQAIEDGMDQGESITQLAARVNEVFDEADKVRARMIAQTEAVGSLNTAAQTYAANLPEGIVDNKAWLAHHDDRTRPTHRIADGQTVKVIEPFVVGDALLMEPGDRTGPPGEVINCRCTAVHLPPGVTLEMLANSLHGLVPDTTLAALGNIKGEWAAKYPASAATSV